jgi:hypothetical protein
VKRRHGREIEGADEVDDVPAVLAAPDPVLVLDRDDAGALAERAGGPQVVGELFLADLMVGFDRVPLRRRLRWMKDDDLATAGVGRQVAGERGNPAVSRRIG